MYFSINARKTSIINILQVKNLQEFLLYHQDLVEDASMDQPLVDSEFR